MTKELIVQEEKFDLIADIDYVTTAAQKLMKAPHYAKMGQDGIFAIVQCARSLGMNPLQALNGGLYYLNGKVGMSAEMMTAMIRKAGHSIVVDPKTCDEVCVLHGKRADNGDTCTVTFSLADAKKAGIYKNTWEKYPGDMCFARAVSKLKRRLFSDIAMNVYERGEVEDMQGQPTTAFVPFIEPEPTPDLSPDDFKIYIDSFGPNKELFCEYMEYVADTQMVDMQKAVNECYRAGAKTKELFEKWKKKRKKTMSVPENVVMALDPADALSADIAKTSPE